MSEGQKLSVQIDLTEDEIEILIKLAKNRNMSLDEFVLKVLSKYSSY